MGTCDVCISPRIRPPSLPPPSPFPFILFEQIVNRSRFFSILAQLREFIYILRREKKKGEEEKKYIRDNKFFSYLFNTSTLYSRSNPFGIEQRFPRTIGTSVTLKAVREADC